MSTTYINSEVTYFCAEQEHFLSFTTNVATCPRGMFRIWPAFRFIFPLGGQNQLPMNAPLGPEYFRPSPSPAKQISTCEGDAGKPFWHSWLDHHVHVVIIFIWLTCFAYVMFFYSGAHVLCHVWVSGPSPRPRGWWLRWWLWGAGVWCGGGRWVTQQ